MGSGLEGRSAVRFGRPEGMSRVPVTVTDPCPVSDPRSPTGGGSVARPVVARSVLPWLRLPLGRLEDELPAYEVALGVAGCVAALVAPSAAEPHRRDADVGHRAREAVARVEQRVLDRVV